MNQRVTSLIPSQGTRLGCWPGLQLGARKKQLLQTQGGVNDILLPNGPTLVLRESPRPVLGSPCPPPRKRCLSMPEIGEKERDYLFKELHKLKSNNLMSSLRSQNPLEYPQMYTVLPSPSDQSGVPYLRKRNRRPWFFSAQAVWSQKNPAWRPCLGLNPSTNLPLQPHF